MDVSKRMEVLDLRSSITQAKIMGTIVSISGALIVVFYKGPTIMSVASQEPPLSHHFPLGSSQTKRIKDSLLLATQYLLTCSRTLLRQFFEISVFAWDLANSTREANVSAKFEFCDILQAQVMKIYPAEFIQAFLFFLRACDNCIYTSMFNSRRELKYF